jgi:hypothetical protein
MTPKLTRDQWYELDDQYNRTPEQPGEEGVPGEHFKLIGLLNGFGFHPMSKQEAMKLAGELLGESWIEADNAED